MGRGSRVPRWLVRRVEQRLAAERAAQTTDDFDTFTVVQVQAPTDPWVGMVMQVDAGRLLVKDVDSPAHQQWVGPADLTTM